MNSRPRQAVCLEVSGEALRHRPCDHSIQLVVLKLAAEHDADLAPGLEAASHLSPERVVDPADISEFGDAWVSNAMFLRHPDDLEEVWVYRLVPR